MGMLSQGYKMMDAAGRQNATLAILDSVVMGDDSKNKEAKAEIIRFDVNPTSISLNLGVAINPPPIDVTKEQDAKKDAEVSKGEKKPDIVNEATMNYVMGNTTGSLSFTGYFDVSDLYDELNNKYAHFSATSIKVQNKVNGLLKSNAVSKYLSKEWDTFKEKFANKCVNGTYATDAELEKKMEESTKSGEKPKEGLNKVVSDAKKKEEKERKAKDEEIKKNLEKYNYKILIEKNNLMHPDSPVCKLQQAAQNDKTFMFVYGPKQFGPAKLTSLSIEYSYFSKSGAPLKAKVSVSLQAGGGQKVSEWMKPNENFRESYSGLSSLLNGFLEKDDE